MRTQAKPPPLAPRLSFSAEDREIVEQLDLLESLDLLEAWDPDDELPMPELEEPNAP